MRAAPLSGSQNLKKRWAIVVLPAPEGPTSATVLPAGMTRLTSSRAGRARPAYVNVTCSISSAALERRAAGTPGPSGTATGAVSIAWKRRVAPSVSASWRPTWAISHTGTKADTASSVMTGRIAGSSRP